MFDGKITKYGVKYSRSDNSITYLTKLAKYVHKKVEFESQRGGAIVNFVRHENSVSNLGKNIEGLVDLIRNTLRGSTKYDLTEQRQKYCVFLVGAPGVGKSKGLEMVVDRITTMDRLEMNQVDFLKSFISMNVDDYTYGKVDESGESGTIELLRAKNKMIERYGEEEVKKMYYDKSTPGRSDWLKEPRDIYFRRRGNINALSDIMIAIAVYFEMNIVFETVGRDINYIEQLIISVCKYSNYIPVITHVTMTNDTLHMERVFSRYLKEGRILDFDEIKSLKEQVKKLYSKENILALMGKNGIGKYFHFYVENNDKSTCSVEKHDVQQMTLEYDIVKQ